MRATLAPFAARTPSSVPPSVFGSARPRVATRLSPGAPGPSILRQLPRFEALSDAFERPLNSRFFPSALPLKSPECCGQLGSVFARLSY